MSPTIRVPVICGSSDRSTYLIEDSTQQDVAEVFVGRTFWWNHSVQDRDQTATADQCWRREQTFRALCCFVIGQVVRSIRGGLPQ